MQDLRQDLRQHHDYGDGGSSRRGGRGGGTGLSPGGGGRGFGRGRGYFDDTGRYEREKFERVQKMRQNSRASMRRRQIQALDISGTMAAPSVLAARDAALSAPHTTAADADSALKSSFDNLPHEPRTVMHDAFYTREPFHNAAAATAAAQQTLDAGDLAVALENALEACRGGGAVGTKRFTEDYLIRSKIGGKFVARPDQEELVRKSGASASTGRKLNK